MKPSQHRSVRGSNFLPGYMETLPNKHVSPKKRNYFTVFFFLFKKNELQGLAGHSSSPLIKADASSQHPTCMHTCRSICKHTSACLVSLQADHGARRRTDATVVVKIHKQTNLLLSAPLKPALLSPVPYYHWSTSVLLCTIKDISLQCVID